MTEIALAVVGVLLLAAMVAAFLLYRQLVATRGVVAERERAIEGYAAQIDAEQARVAELDKHLAVARQAESDVEKRLRERDEQYALAIKQSEQSFKVLAGETLKTATDEFLKRADQTFNGKQKDAAVQLDQRKAAIEALVKPIQEKLTEATRVVHEMDKSRKLDQGGLKQQLDALTVTHRDLNRQTSALSNAMRGNITAQGQWGEVALQRLIELAGMTHHCDFQTQHSVRYDEARLKPDVVVRLPADRCIVIDAKTTGKNYIAASQSADESERKSYLDQHARDLRGRVKELKGKDYGAAVSGAFDMVIMFVPVEAYLSSAAVVDGSLIEDAFQSGIVITTPTTLLPLLKAIAIGWREEKLADNAKKIAKLGSDLHQRLAVMIGHVQKVGASLDQANRHYNSFVGSIERQVMPQARKFRKYEAASNKKLPSADQIHVVETQPREIQLNEQDRPAPETEHG